MWLVEIACRSRKKQDDEVYTRVKIDSKMKMGMNHETLFEVKSFKYLAATVVDNDWVGSYKISRANEGWISLKGTKLKIKLKIKSELHNWGENHFYSDV